MGPRLNGKDDPHDFALTWRVSQQDAIHDRNGRRLIIVELKVSRKSVLSFHDSLQTSSDRVTTEAEDSSFGRNGTEILLYP